MNKMEFNRVLAEVGNLTVDIYAQKFSQAFTNISPPYLCFEVCTYKHIGMSKSWPDTSRYKDGYGDWSWEKIFNKFRYSADKFIIAVSSNGYFGGLFSGKLLSVEVELQLVQRNANCSALKGFMIPASITYSAILGRVMSRSTVSVCEPAPKIISLYENSMKGDVNFSRTRKGVVKRMSISIDEILTPSTD